MSKPSIKEIRKALLNNAPSTRLRLTNDLKTLLKAYDALQAKADKLAEAMVDALNEMLCLGTDLDELNSGIRNRPTALLCRETYEDCEQALKEYRGDKLK